MTEGWAEPIKALPVLRLPGPEYGDSAGLLGNWEGWAWSSRPRSVLAPERVALADKRDEFCSNAASVAFCLESGMEVVAEDAGWIVG